MEGVESAVDLAAHDQLTHPDSHSRKPAIHDGAAGANVPRIGGLVRSEARHLCTILLPFGLGDALNLFPELFTKAFSSECPAVLRRGG